MRPKKLKLEEIRIDGGTQVRVQIDLDKVNEYAERMSDGDVFRAVEICFDGTDHWLWDGFHRYHAQRKLGQREITAIVRPGTKDDAIWKSLNANRTNGLPMNNADKAKAVRTALAKWPEKSDGEIAKHVGVNRRTVLRYRHDLTCPIGQVKPGSTCDKVTSRVGADGRTTNTSNIGKVKVYGPPTTQSADREPVNIDDIPMDMPAGNRQVEIPPKEPEIPKDMVGNPLPMNRDKTNKIADAFERRDEVTVLMSALSDIKAKVVRAAAEGNQLFAEITVSQFQADLNNARRALRAARPYAVCPYCSGDGCKACLNRGWVGQFVYDAAPKDLKS